MFLPQETLNQSFCQFKYGPISNLLVAELAVSKPGNSASSVTRRCFAWDVCNYLINAEEVSRRDDRTG
jgi:hypothetical protein